MSWDAQSRRRRPRTRPKEVDVNALRDPSKGGYGQPKSFGAYGYSDCDRLPTRESTGLESGEVGKGLLRSILREATASACSAPDGMGKSSADGQSIGWRTA